MFFFVEKNPVTLFDQFLEGREVVGPEDYRTTDFFTINQVSGLLRILGLTTQAQNATKYKTVILFGDNYTSVEQRKEGQFSILTGCIGVSEAEADLRLELQGVTLVGVSSKRLPLLLIAQQQYMDLIERCLREYFP